ncbi:NAD(P)/FAD-dependent oxidoreductase [Candidatus Methylospira mobilis]|uniref:NAD(P)/FAD-dependent oxidoreductase n=1 Tax=Candidatus Methylospira mobilis TaxID=1808979 RepID=A0A5Q0BK19_9GAMM|nr:NAD(P)/FAD-dependent oxidoreductase [Candidatus Methylospira mobilis]QFY43472.1 NAD(P)/FAD-dependent oxidoreductase [Candidatus Methylospira mobilis]WNV03986.1 NAD(P)/FAD-dependent oxidoreductase [Candidatus Methylospira mobilis]
MKTEKVKQSLPRLLIVGGGAGGLELATRLGNSWGKRQKASITLIDAGRTHIWKPLLHEVAAGTLDVHDDEVDYLAQAYNNHFHFMLGRMSGLNRAQKTITIAPMLDEKGEEIVPERFCTYDYLVIAVGSVCNDFGISGVAGNCLFLDTTAQAEQFHHRLLEAYLRAHVQGGVRVAGQLDIAIVGGGATGIELSAQLHQAAELLNAYGLDNVKPADIHINLIEASQTLLPELPKRLSQATLNQLRLIGVSVHLGERVVAVDGQGIHTQSGLFIPAVLKVWAAGIKAPDFLAHLDGLETNRINQLRVRSTLQTTEDDHIFAIGDCSACPWPEKGPEATVPPRAQAAHQMATLVFDNLQRSIKGKKLENYHYRDYGSLVALGKFSTVGNLMGNLMGSVMIEGAIARLVYLSLYKMHQMALFGPFRLVLLMVSGFFHRRLRPRIKLH